MADINEFFKKLGIGSPETVPSPMMAPTDSRPVKAMASPEDDEFAPSPEDDIPASEDGTPDNFQDVQPMKKGASLMSKADIAKIQAIPLPPGQQSQRAPAEVPAASAAQAQTSDELSPDEDKTSKIRDLLSQYQEARNGNQKNLNMLRGADQIAQAFAMGSGAKIGDGSEAVNALEKQLDQPTKDYQARLDDEANQPGSDISKFAREQAINVMARMNPNIDRAAYVKKFANMSAKQLEKLGFKGAGTGTTHVASKEEKFLVNGHPAEYDPYTGYRDAITKKPLGPEDRITNAIPRINPVTQQLEYTMTNDAFNPGKAGTTPGSTPSPTGSPSATGAPEASTAKFIPNVAQRGALEKDGTQFEEGIKSHITRLQDIDALLHELEGNNKLQIPAVSERMAKIAKGTGGVLNAQEEQRFAGSNQILDRINQFFQTHTEGTFTPENKAQFRELAKNYIDTAKQAIPDVRNRFAKRLEMNYQIPQDFSTKYFGGDVTTPYIDKVAAQDSKNNKSNSGVKKTPAGQVHIKSSDGQDLYVPKGQLEATKKLDPDLKVVDYGE